jgi:hypothetical protein
MTRVERRVFLVGSLGLLAAPLAAETQSVGKVFRVAYLTAASTSTDAPLFDSFGQGMRELGYLEGRNIAYEIRRAEGTFERLPGLAAELVGLKPDIIVVFTTPAALAAKDATRTIPIVMVGTGDPVGDRARGQSRPTRRKHHREHQDPPHPIPMGPRAGRGQGTRTAWSRQERGVAVSSDPSEPPIGSSPTGSRANHAPEPAIWHPRPRQGRVGAPVPHGTAGTPSSGGCPGVRRRGIVAGSEPESGDVRYALSPVPARESPAGEVLRGMRRPSQGGEPRHAVLRG